MVCNISSSYQHVNTCSEIFFHTYEPSLRRMEIGPALEDISTKIFFQYPDFALHFAERLEKALGLQVPDIDASNSGSCSEYEKIRQGILAEFDYDIGPAV